MQPHINQSHVVPGPWVWWLPGFALPSWVESGFWSVKHFMPFEKDSCQVLYIQISRYRQLHSALEFGTPPLRQDLLWSPALFHHPYSTLIIKTVLLPLRGTGSWAWTSRAFHPQGSYSNNSPEPDVNKTPHMVFWWSIENELIFSMQLLVDCMGKALKPPPQPALTHTCLFCLEEVRKVNYCIFTIMGTSF